MRPRTRKKREARVWAWVHRLKHRALDRHDRWDVLAAHAANPWRTVPLYVAAGLYLAHTTMAAPIRSKSEP